MPNTAQFTNACLTIKKLKTSPSDEELGRLYGLYKQATLGDNNTPEPTGLFDFVGKRKWTSWNENKGMNTYNSEVKYITLVNELIKKYKI